MIRTTLTRVIQVSTLATATLLNISCSRTDVKTDQDIMSPDKTLVFHLSTQGNSGLCYEVTMDGETIIQPSRLGMVLKEGDEISDNLEIIGVSAYSKNETWETVWGEERYITDHHNGKVITLQEKDGLRRKFGFEVRVFDDGFGFRYLFPEQSRMEDLTINAELTEFNFRQDHDIWWMNRNIPYYEAYGQKNTISQIDTAYTPVTLCGRDGRFYSIHEAALTDWAKMNLVSTGVHGLKAELTPLSDGTKVHTSAPCSSPWRTVIDSRDLPGLAASRIMLNLNEPCKIEDTSWIKPGKYIGIWWILHKFQNTWYEGPKHGATTERTREYIDFAAENGIQAVLVEGWNKGWKGDWMKNTKGFSFTEAYPDYDFDGIMEYAQSKGVQIIIHNETGADTEHYLKHIDEAYKLYQSHGMHYVKTGNVNLLMDGKEEHDSQYAVQKFRTIVEKAATYQICIDEHEPVIPTGLNRTWPNLMTHEAIRGQEHDAWDEDGGNKPEHQTVVPFLRGLAGPTDYTFGTFDFSNPANPDCRVRTTLAKQLAQYVVIYSPLQMASDDPSAYRNNKAFGFIRDVPTDWDCSKVLDAVIGDYVMTARKDRNSEDWYLGAITDENSRILETDLDFLEEGKTYLAQIYEDGENASYEKAPESWAYSEKKVKRGDRMVLRLATSGGCAIRFIAL